jgi:hypothetical protein
MAVALVSADVRRTKATSPEKKIEGDQEFLFEAELFLTSLVYLLTS